MRILIFFGTFLFFVCNGYAHHGEKDVESYGASIFGKNDAGGSLVIKGEPARKIFELLAKSAGNEKNRVKDGIGITCYSEENKSLYCMMPLDENGVLDLIEIPEK